MTAWDSLSSSDSSDYIVWHVVEPNAGTVEYVSRAVDRVQPIDLGVLVVNFNLGHAGLGEARDDDAGVGEERRSAGSS